MMHTMDTLDIQTTAIWEAWNRRGFADRCRLLEPILEQLPAHAEAAATVRLAKQLLQDAAALEPVIALPGPTGESNELYLTGRGVVLVLGNEQSTHSLITCQLLAALACGNAVALHWPEQAEWSSALVDACHQSGVPKGALVLSEATSSKDLLQTPDLRLVISSGTPEQIIALNRTLAAQDGVLIQLVAETDTTNCPQLVSPDFLLRLVTEKTRTINTTAVGGNATLLELGSSAV
jgi:delta 1-pyrroline-5-carboxylate dehydrogenase